MHLTDIQLNEYLDEAVASDVRAQIESHLSSCDECEARLTTLQNLFIEIESLPEIKLTRNLAAPFISPRNLPAQVPTWFPLTVTLQVIISLVVLIVAAPLAIELLPVIEMPSLNTAFIQSQTQWTTIWAEILLLHSQFQVPTIPSLPFELSSLYIMSAVVIASMFWLVGNGLLLRNQIK